MREIKFRAWDKDNSAMMDCDIVLPLLCRLVKHPDSYAVMQFTGLTDKNGKEIFEGDILSMKLNDKLTENGEVFWDRGRYFWSRDKQYNLSEVLHEAKLIGNIYKNPELLGELEG